MIQVLYVDDEPGLLEIGKIFLERTTWMQVHTEESARLALDSLKRNSYDAVISDYQMPEMDGIGFLKVVRSKFGDIPFILFTGKGREEVVIQALNNGADYYLQKGGDTKTQFAELHHLLQQVVKQRRTEHALHERTRQYEQVVKAQTEFICRFSPDGKHLFANDAYYNYFGMESEDIIGKKFRPDIYPSDLKALESHFASLSGQNPVSTIDHRIIMPDGVVRWQRWTDRAIFNYQGDIVEYQSVGRDISDIKEVEEDLRRKNEELSAAYEQITAIEEELRQNYDELSRKERELRESEQNYRSVIESIQDGFYRSDCQGRLVMASPSIAQLFGYDSLDQVLGKDIAQMLWQHPEKRKEFVSEIAAQGAVTNYEIVMKNARGETIVVSANSHKYYGDDGDVRGEEGIVRDITAQKAANDALEESRNRLHAILQGSPIPTFVLDHEHRVIVWNRALEEYSSVASPDITGKAEPWKAFYSSKRPCMADFIIDGNVEGLLQAYGKNCAKSSLIEGAYAGTAFFPHMKDGVWLFFTAAPVQDRDGRIIGCVETLQDVTGKYEKEQELRMACEQMEVAFEEAKSSEDMLLVQNRKLILSEQRYRNIVEDQTEFICRFLPDGRHVFVNEAYCRYFGKERNELIGNVFTPDIPEEDRVLVRQHLDKLTPGHPVAIIVHRIIMPDGAVRWHRWSDRAIFEKIQLSDADDAGDRHDPDCPVSFPGSGPGTQRERVVEYQSVGRDITDLIVVESALRQGNRKLNLLNSITRHDILNKVFVALGYLEILKMDQSPADITENVGKLESVMKDIRSQIEFTKIYQDIGIRDPAWQDVGGVIQGLAVPGSIHVECSIHGIGVYADPMLEKVLYNLLDNSVRHGQKVTVIRVSAVQSDGKLVIVWEDNGVGISTRDRKHLFEKGYGKHTGLGLFLAREILAITDIAIQETGMEGEGARFEIHVPKEKFRKQQPTGT